MSTKYSLAYGHAPAQSIYIYIDQLIFGQTPLQGFSCQFIFFPMKFIHELKCNKYDIER